MPTPDHIPAIPEPESGYPVPPQPRIRKVRRIPLTPQEAEESVNAFMDWLRRMQRLRDTDGTLPGKWNTDTGERED